MAQAASRCVRWLQSQLPALVSRGVLTPDAAAAVASHYAGETARSRNFGMVLLAAIGSALVGAGVILLIAHNWDELSRPTRTVIAFAPLLIAQALAVFVLLRRPESQPWRESAAIFDVAAVATAISLVSQTYQIQGTFADFMCVWLLLSIPVVYIFRSSLGAVAFVIGTVIWLSAKSNWGRTQPELLFFWLFLLAIVPYYLALLRRGRFSRESVTMSIVLMGAIAIGLGFVTEYTQSSLGGGAFAGLFAGVYLCGIRFFPHEDGRLSALALLGGVGVGITAIVLSFESAWHIAGRSSWTWEGAPRSIGIAIQIFFPVAALAIFILESARRNRIVFSIAAGLAPLVAGVAWMIAHLAPVLDRDHDNPYAFAAALLFNVYGLLLGIELLGRGVRVNSTARANFGLLVIVALALARFFDSDLSFLTRGLGFIAVGIGFLVTNVILFKRRPAT